MAKNINIHIKAKGTQQTKQELAGVGRSAEQMGSKTARAGAWIRKSLSTLGFAAVAAAIAAAALKVAKFFDELKRRTDEAVKNVEDLRAGYTDLFEAMGAFSEAERKAVTVGVAETLMETGVSKQVGLPVINAYERQFGELRKSGQLTEQQYQEGLKGMLTYGARHGGAATPELIAIMKGWGMVTPEQQGAFRRQIATGAGVSGLTDEELIGALGRGMSTIQAMGWTPEEAVSTIATLAAGEVGRKKASLPATTLQGLLAPQLTNVAKYGISEEIAQDPQQLLAALAQRRGTMDQQRFMRMLLEIYGTEAAAGVSKLLGVPQAGLRATLAEAAGPVGVAAEIEEERKRQTTFEALKAKGEARAEKEVLDVRTSEKYMEEVRKIGAAKRERLRRREPVLQFLKEFFAFEQQEKEEAAFRAWFDSLSPEEKAVITQTRGGQFSQVWEQMTPKEKYQSLTINNIHNDNSINTNYNPLIGRDDHGKQGPRMEPGVY